MSYRKVCQLNKPQIIILYLTQRIMAGHSKNKNVVKDQMTLDTTDKATRRVIAPYVKIVRKSKGALEKTKESQKFSYYLQNKPSVLLQDWSCFLSDSVDLASVLQETAVVLKTVTKASGNILVIYQK